MKQTSLCFLMRDNEILLAMKKRGFGAGRWNGAGGKLDEGKGDKNILDAAMRETKEEIGVEIKNPQRRAIFHFRFAEKPEWDQDVTMFIAKEWEGEPQESEEMMPRWFKLDELPYKDMWPDDIHWMPHILAGKKIEADFTFGPNDKILDYKIWES